MDTKTKPVSAEIADSAENGWNDDGDDWGSLETSSQSTSYDIRVSLLTHLVVSSADINTRCILPD